VLVMSLPVSTTWRGAGVRRGRPHIPQAPHPTGGIELDPWHLALLAEVEVPSVAEREMVGGSLRWDGWLQGGRVA
jgi:hypothetical protein